MTLSLIFNLFTTVGAIVLVAISFSIFISAYSDNIKLVAYKNFFTKYALQFIFWASFVAVAGSLVYSELFLFEPCVLCWWQRIFIYPVLVISTVAFVEKYKNLAAQINPFQYINPLMWIALPFSLYHNYLLLRANASTDSFFCDPALAGSCSDRFVEVLSVIDIPFMALAIILFILVISTLASKEINKRPNN